MKVIDLYRWGYQQDRGISFLTNVIQCHCGNKAKKMRGLYAAVMSGRDVRPAQFDLFTVVIDGVSLDVRSLEDFDPRAVAAR